MANQVTRHPLYARFLERWNLGIDSFDGELTIKSKGTKYLPLTSGMIEDGAGTGNTESEGYKAYKAYVVRAVYPEIYKEAVKAAIGIMHRKPPTIELPTVLESLLERATSLGESLPLLLRRINTRQLVTGRIGIMGDLVVGAGAPEPIITTYNDVTILNWDDTNTSTDGATISLVVLDESGYERNELLEWTFVNKTRVLALIEDEMFSTAGVYQTGVFTEGDGTSITPAGLEQPERQGAALDKIPFSFVNATDIATAPDTPPLEGLANLCMAIYRGEADYRQSLFMQGQDTLVTIGRNAGPDDAPVRTGAGACIDIRNAEGDAKYIGVSSEGLAEQREALQNDYNRANQKAGQISNATSRAAESGDALQIRVAAQAATLPEIAMAGAEGLANVLRVLAQWFGANPDEVVVTPNLEFADQSGDGLTLKQIIESKVLGAPISNESVHAWMQENGFTRNTYEEELALIENEGGALGSDTNRRVDANSEDS